MLIPCAFSKKQYIVSEQCTVNFYGGWSVPKCRTFFRKVNLHSSFIMGDNFYIQINYNTFGMWICISKSRNTFGMTNSISKWRDTFGMTNSISKCRNTFGVTNSISKWKDTFGTTNSISKFEHGDLWPARLWCVLYGTFQVCLSSSVFGMLQRIVRGGRTQLTFAR